VAYLTDLQAEKEAALAGAVRALDAQAARAEALTEVERAFGRAGIQSYLLEAAIIDLQERTNGYLEDLTGSFSLELRPFKEKPATGSGGAGGRGKRKAAAAGAAAAGTAAPSPAPPEEVEVVEKIEKVITVTYPDGTRFVRSLRQCSGGERRRVALALTLGFRDLISDRAGLRANLLVLDEVMQLLDLEGVRRTCRVLRGLGAGPGGQGQTVLLVAQAGTLATRELEAVDTVVKEDGVARLRMG
jgi:hypothetical protein